MAQWSHGETTTDRQRAGGESAARRSPCHRFGTTARGPSGAAAGRGIGNAGANGGHLGGGSGDRPTIAAALPPVGTAAGDAAPLGRAAQGAAQCGSKKRSSWHHGPRRPRRPACWCSRRSAPHWRNGWDGRWPPRWCGACWLGTDGARWPRTRATPRAIPLAQEAWKKNSPKYWRPSLNPVDLQGRSVRLMFQDEARFGRMARPRRCWAPLPWRAGHAQWL